MLKDISKIEPVGCSIIVELGKQEEETKIGEIIIPETKDRLAMFVTGKVIAIGPSAFRYLDKEEKNVNVGDKVLVVKNAGILLCDTGDVGAEHEEKKYRLVNDEDVRMVWKE